MHTFQAEFIRFTEATMHQVLGAIGVYVIWDSKADNIPTYIGEGEILSRFVISHNAAFKPPLDGYIAITGYKEQKVAEVRDAKEHAQILEAMILWIADQTGRLPSVNRKQSGMAAVAKKLGKENLLRVSLSGYDFFVHPARSKNLDGDKKIIRIHDVGDGFLIEHKWRRLSS